MLTDTTLGDEDPDDDGLDSFTHEQIRSFSMALGVQSPSRSNHAPETQTWHMMVPNPKSSSLELAPDHPLACFMAPLTHPHLTRLVNVFIKQQRPHFRYTTFALREDLSRPPHRDVRNGPCGTLFQVLSKGPGGGLWILCKGGPDTREHNGTLVQGLNLTAQDQPIVFDARRLLHASQNWPNNARRVVLIAWTVISVRTLPCGVVQQLTEVGFPVPSTADLSVEIAQDWMPDPSLPVTKRLKQTPLVFKRPESQDPGLVLENGAVTQHLD